MSKLQAVLRRRWPILVVTTVLGLLAGLASVAVGGEREVTQYQAEQVIVANRLVGNPADVEQDALKVNRGAVLRVAADALGQPEREDDLAAEVEVDADTESSSIRLTVFDVDPQEASRVVQAFANSFLTVVNSELRSDDQRRIDDLTARVQEATAALTAFDDQNGFISRPDTPLPQTPTIDALVAERQRLQTAVSDAQRRLDDAALEISRREPYSSLGPEAPRVADAQLLEVPSSPTFRAGLIGMLGLLLGVALVLVLERVNRRVDTRDEMAELLSVPILAEIGRINPRKQPKHDDGRLKLEGAWSEHYRRVRSAIQFVQATAEQRNSAPGANGTVPGANGTAPAVGVVPSAVISHHDRGRVPRVFMFVSALPSEGKSTSTALTALALAEAGLETVTINADFRRPRLDDLLGASKRPSLADSARMDVHRPTADEVVRPGPEPHLWTVAAGPPTREVGPRLAAARELAEEAARRGATVLIDSSPLRVSNDPIDLFQAVDEVILVVRAGKSTVKSLQDTMELLEMHHAPVMGVVLIGTLATREMYAYYQEYYQQAAAPDVAPASAGAPVPAAPAPVPAHAAAPAAVPNGAVPNGAVPNGAVPNGAVPPAPPTVPGPMWAPQRTQSASAVDQPNPNLR